MVRGSGPLLNQNLHLGTPRSEAPGRGPAAALIRGSLGSSARSRAQEGPLLQGGLRTWTTGDVNSFPGWLLRYQFTVEITVQIQENLRAHPRGSKLSLLPRALCDHVHAGGQPPPLVGLVCVRLCDDSGWAPDSASPASFLQELIQMAWPSKATEIVRS